MNKKLDSRKFFHNFKTPKNILVSPLVILNKCEVVHKAQYTVGYGITF